MQKDISGNSKAAKTIARGALTVMSAFVISNLVGLLAKTLTARYFGTGIESNAFFAANRFSEILFNLVAGGGFRLRFYSSIHGASGKKRKSESVEISFSGYEFSNNCANYPELINCDFFQTGCPLYFSAWICGK